MNLRNLAERTEFLCALKVTGFFDFLRQSTLNCDHETAQRIIRGFFESYAIVDQWLRDAFTGTIDYWFSFPESAAAKLGHFVPVFPKFEPPQDPGDMDEALRDFNGAWKALARPPQWEISEAALWTALRFCSMPSGKIARDYCLRKSKNHEAIVEKTVSRFAKRIGLTMPDHSRCPHNEFLAAHRKAGQCTVVYQSGTS